MRKMFGFTLIELLIVIAVIAILVGITVPRFLGMRDEANSAKASGETSALKAATEAYRIHKGFFPKNATDETAGTATWQSDLTAMKPQLIESVLVDPFNSAAAPANEYTFMTSAAANPKYYVIFSLGPDGVAGVTAINNSTGALTKAADCDDIYATNGKP